MVGDFSLARVGKARIIPSMRPPAILLVPVFFGSLAPVGGAAVVTSPGIAFVKSDTVTTAPLYTTPTATVSETSSTDPDGFARTTTTANDHLELTSTVTTDTYGGTKHSSSTQEFQSTSRERTGTDGSSLQFDRTYQFSTTLDYTRSVSTFGNFIFIDYAKLAVGFEATRQISLTLDGPVAVSLVLRAEATRTATFPNSLSGTNLDPAGIFSSLVVFGGDPAFVNLVLVNTLAGLETGPVELQGTKKDVNYHISASVENGALNLEMLFSPAVAGQPVDLELRYFLRGDTGLSFPISAPGTRSAQGSIAGDIQESLTVRPVPEPGGAELAACGAAALLLRRRRTPVR